MITEHVHKFGAVFTVKRRSTIRRKCKCGLSIHLKFLDSGYARFWAEIKGGSTCSGSISNINPNNVDLWDSLFRNRPEDLIAFVGAATMVPA